MVNIPDRVMIYKQNNPNLCGNPSCEGHSNPKNLVIGWYPQFCNRELIILLCNACYSRTDESRKIKKVKCSDIPLI